MTSVWKKTWQWYRVCWHIWLHKERTATADGADKIAYLSVGAIIHVSSPWDNCSLKCGAWQWTIEWSPAELRFNIYMHLLWEEPRANLLLGRTYRLIRTTNGEMRIESATLGLEGGPFNHCFITVYVLGYLKTPDWTNIQGVKQVRRFYLRKYKHFFTFLRIKTYRSVIECADVGLL